MFIFGYILPTNVLLYLLGSLFALGTLMYQKPTRQRLWMMMAAMIIIQILALIPSAIQKQQDLLWPIATIIFMSLTQTAMVLTLVKDLGVNEGFKMMATIYITVNLLVSVLLITGIIG